MSRAGETKIKRGIFTRVWFSFGDVLGGTRWVLTDTAREGQEAPWGHQTPLPSQPGGEMSLLSSPLIQVGNARSRAGTPHPPTHPWEPREGEFWSKGASRTAGEWRKVSPGPQTSGKSQVQSGRLSPTHGRCSPCPSMPRSGCPSSPGSAQHQLQPQLSTGQVRA